ncbi:MAG: cysteine hydrolase [Firmicutes bacterium]|nr:cysteine hydrolase [Bacillota bacterium]
MKKGKGRIIMLLVIVIILLIASIIGGRLYILSKVTSGNKISSDLQSNSALVVLDVQNDTLGIKEYESKDTLIKNINSAITYANDNNIDIIYTKQAFSHPLDKLLSGGLYVKNKEGIELSRQLEVLSSNIFEKEKTDAFSNKDFENHLLEQEITTLYIVGADASACVYKTALAGINRDYKVVVLADCIFSVNEKMYNQAIDNYKSNNIEIQYLKNFIK